MWVKNVNRNCACPFIPNTEKKDILFLTAFIQKYTLNITEMSNERYNIFTEQAGLAVML
jgi:hypothetical protein